MRVWMTVIYPVNVEVEFDTKRFEDDDYIESKQEEAKDLADNILTTSTIKPVIHAAQWDELVE